MTALLYFFENIRWRGISFFKPTYRPRIPVPSSGSASSSYFYLTSCEGAKVQSIPARQTQRILASCGQWLSPSSNKQHTHAKKVGLSVCASGTRQLFASKTITISFSRKSLRCTATKPQTARLSADGTDPCGCTDRLPERRTSSAPVFVQPKGGCRERAVCNQALRVCLPALPEPPAGGTYNQKCHSSA